MKKIPLLILGLLLLPVLTTAATVHENELFTVGSEEINLTNVINDRVIFTSDHQRFIIRENDCEDYSIYLICVENVTDDRVENYPHRFAVEVTTEKLCDECVGWGEDCEEDKPCDGACAEGVCRPSNPWCGDEICAETETYSACPEDCPAPITNTTTNTTQNQSSTTNQNTTQETQQETNTTETPTTQETPQEQPEETAQAEEQTSSPPQIIDEETNWLAAGLIIFGGLAIILVIFNKKKKKPADLYSYRK